GDEHDPLPAEGAQRPAARIRVSCVRRGRGVVRHVSERTCEVTMRSVASAVLVGAVTVAALGAPSRAGAQETNASAGQVAGCPADPAGFWSCAKEKARTFEPPRTPDGHPDLSGYWATRRQAMIVEAHPESQGIRAEPSIIVDPADGRMPHRSDGAT